MAVLHVPAVSEVHPAWEAAALAVAADLPVVAVVAEAAAVVVADKTYFKDY